MTFLEYAGLMQKLSEAEVVKEKDGKYTCLLRVGQSPQPLYFCNKSHALLSASVRRKIDGTFYASLIINSIDDIMCSITGPVETEKKANKRLLKLLEYVEIWGGQIPPVQHFKYTATLSGCYAKTHI